MSVTRSTRPDPVPGFDDAHAPIEPPAADPTPDEPVDPAIDLALLRRYRELRSAADVSEAEMKAYKEEAATIEAQLVEMFTDAELQNINVDGKTLYLHRSVFAQRKPGATAEDVIEALRAAGAGDLVKDNVASQTLSAYVRELTEDDDAPGLPEEVAAVLEAGERYAIRIRNAPSKAKRPAKK